MADPAAPAPIAILSPGPDWSYVCVPALRLDTKRDTLQGTCACGWLTEAVPRRRARELMGLESQHVADTLAAMRAYFAARTPDPSAGTQEFEAQTLAALDGIGVLIGVLDEVNGRGDA